MMLRRWAARAGLAVAITGGAFFGSTFFVTQSVERSIARGQSSAAEIATLGSILNSFGVAVWPKFGSDPFTCNPTNEGAYYFNTGTSAFRTCDGTTWADGGGGAGALNDLSDVFVSSPTNNQALIYDGAVDNRWENAAQGAAAITDHSDALVTTPTDGDILQYDGVTDNRWENVAGAAPTTFSGLSDTVVTTPTNRQMIRWDGTDWVNEDEHFSGPYVFFPWQTQDAGTETITTSAVIASANQVRAFCHVVPHPINLDRIIWRLDGDGAGCNFGGVALYDQAGTTKIFDSGAVAYTTANTVITADPANVYLEPGTYYVAITADATTCTVNVLNDNESTDDAIELILQELDAGSNCARAATSSNSSTAGALPTSLGTLTFNLDINRPIILFEGADPP